MRVKSSTTENEDERNLASDDEDFHPAKRRTRNKPKIIFDSDDGEGADDLFAVPKTVTGNVNPKCGFKIYKRESWQM